MLQRLDIFLSIIIFGSLKFMLIEPYDNNANANTSDNESIEIKLFLG